MGDRVVGRFVRAVRDVELRRDEVVREDDRRVTADRRVQDREKLRLAVRDAAHGEARQRPRLGVVLPVARRIMAAALFAVAGEGHHEIAVVRDVVGADIVEMTLGHVIAAKVHAPRNVEAPHGIGRPHDEARREGRDDLAALLQIHDIREGVAAAADDVGSGRRPAVTVGVRHEGRVLACPGRAGQNEDSENRQ